ncbi:EMSY N-terminal [Macleaya cordata]|uniref:EMSY N-terminal n=1 Tax=Macleaya cordata TaxID=56857 RepID=A0A200PQJ8_MACCD|nr:EMSY N-terminal [Macleaya cordata]
MRFRKGSKIEVLSKEEVPSGSWRCAEIVWGNGHNYDVKYDWCPGAIGTTMTGRVSRKHIRPCPPPVGDAVDWAPGDLVEVLDNISWKIATVLKVMGGSYFLVKPLGSSQELRVHKSYLRVRQSWQHDKWVVVGKGSVICEDGRSNKLSTSRFYKKTSCQVPATVLKAKLRVGDSYFPVENNIGYNESHMVSSRALKRESPYATSQVEANTGAGRKLRAIEKDGRHQRMVSDHPSPLLEKVDAVASPRNVLGEKYMHASFIKQTGFSEMDMERAEPNGDVGCLSAGSLEPNDADSSECSVGSCSSTSTGPYRLPFRSLTNPSQETDGYFSDAESFCGLGYEKESPLPTKEELAAEIHKLELHAYRCTMEALYASGPLSWEQEELVTNLRLTLHISNDEHLMEIRNLVSAETCLPIS